MEAKVKSVLSGDTIVLQGLKSNSERILSLAFVSAPRLKREGDEVCYKFPQLMHRSVVQLESYMQCPCAVHAPSRWQGVNFGFEQTHPPNHKNSS